MTAAYRAPYIPQDAGEDGETAAARSRRQFVTALDSRPTTPAVAPGVAARRANRVKQGRPLTVTELDSIVALELTAAQGATHVGDLDTYCQSLLGTGSVSAYEARQIEWAEDTARGAHDEVWRERSEAQARVRRAVGEL